MATRILEDNEAVVDGGIGEVNATTDMYGTCLGNFKITYYCACEKCCNKADGITATGSRVAEGRTIAVDPSVIPYGTKVIIGGHIFTAEDCGGAIKQNHIDIYVNSHEEAEGAWCGECLCISCEVKTLFLQIYYKVTIIIMNCKMRDSKAMKACFTVFSELKTQAFIFI